MTSNKNKSNFKKDENLSTCIEEILKINNDENERSFNSKNLSYYEKFLFLCISPNLDNFKVTYDTINLSTCLQNRNITRSKSSTFFILLIKK